MLKLTIFGERTHILRSAQTVLFERPSLEGFQSVFIEVHFKMLVVVCIHSGLK